MNMSCPAFDPFADRLARDIRNDLSTAFVQGLDMNQDSFYRTAAERYLAGNLPPAHRDYILDRLNRYEQVLAALAQSRTTDSFEQSLVLWNNGLLFEVHERLETIWQNVSHETRKAIKGVIQAIAAYLHRQCGHDEISLRLAQKAADLLGQYGKALPASFNSASIVAWLRKPDLEPPPRL